MASIHLRHRLFVVLAAMAFLGGCATKSVTAFATGRPLLLPEKYFAGHTHSWGIFESRSGQPTSTLTTATDGHWEADGLHFEQDLVFESGKKSHRSWVIHRLDAHRYSATGTGIVGVARGEAYGNVFHLDFTLDVLPGNPLGHLHMSQWMYLQADGKTLVNRDSLTKAGVGVAQISEQFHKDR